MENLMKVFAFWPSKAFPDGPGWTYIPDLFTEADCQKFEAEGWPEETCGCVWWAGDLDELDAYISDSGDPEAIEMWSWVQYDMGRGPAPARWDENAHYRACEAVYNG